MELHVDNRQITAVGAFSSVMRALTRFARYLAPTVLVACVVSLGAPSSSAQEVDVPTVVDAAGERGAVFAPSAWVVTNVPLQERISLKLYGFYIGEFKAPVAQVDVPIRTAKFLTVTPSYMYYSVPASGLNKVTPQPGRFTESYKEHQFRIDGTFAFLVDNFEISARHMYVRRFRPTPADDMNRYRGRIAIARPLAVHERILKPFASYEAFYEPTGGWNRHRAWSGVTLPLNKHVSLQPSYMRETSEGSRPVNYVLFGLILNTK